MNTLHVCGAAFVWLLVSCALPAEERLGFILLHSLMLACSLGATGRGSRGWGCRTTVGSVTVPHRRGLALLGCDSLERVEDSYACFWRAGARQASQATQQAAQAVRAAASETQTQASLSTPPSRLSARQATPQASPLLAWDFQRYPSYAEYAAFMYGLAIRSKGFCAIRNLGNR